MTSNKNILMPTKINDNTHYLYWYILGQYLLESELKFSISPKEKKFVGWGGAFLNQRARNEKKPIQTKYQSIPDQVTKCRTQLRVILLVGVFELKGEAKKPY